MSSRRWNLESRTTKTFVPSWTQKHEGPFAKVQKLSWGEVTSTAPYNTCCHETTVQFSTVIDRESVFPTIFRGLCDVWRTLESATFVTDEKNTSSLGTVEHLKKLVAVRIRGVSLWRNHSNMYPWRCAPSDVSSDMYLKDPVLFMTCSGEQCSKCLQ